MNEKNNQGQTSYINIDEALARVRNNLALYCKLLKMYLASDQFKLFSQNINAKNYIDAAVNIHAIKGITSNLSLNPLYACSCTLNEQLKANITPHKQDLSVYFETEEKTRNAVIDFLALHNA